MLDLAIARSPSLSSKLDLYTYNFVSVMKELLSDTPIEDSVIMVQKGSNMVSRFGGGLLDCCNFATTFRCMCRKPSLS